MTIASSTPTIETPKEKKIMHLVERMQVKPSEELSKICHFQKKCTIKLITSCGIIFLLCGDRKIWQKSV